MINILVVFRDKKKMFIYFLLVFSVCIIMFFLLLIEQYYDYYINNVYGNLVENRGIEIFGNKKDIENIIESNYEIIEPIYSSISLSVGDDIFLVNSFNNIIKNNSVNMLNENEIVVSQNFSLKYNVLVNDFITLNINNNEFTFKIVDIMYHTNVQIYFNSGFYEKNFSIFPKSYYVLLKEYKDVDKTLEKLNNNGFFSVLYDSSYQTNIENFNFVKNKFQIVFIIGFFLSLFFAFNIIKNNIKDESKNIALYKALGYRNSKIMVITISKILILLLLPMFLFCFLCFIILLFLNIINTKVFFDLLSIILCLLIFIILIMFVVFMNAFYLSKYIKELNIFNILGE